jgi:hypothetical protein
MKNFKAIIFAVILIAMFTSCHKMTKREAINFNDNVIFCIDDIEKFQGRASVSNPEEVLTLKDLNYRYNKIIEESNDYKAELKDVFKSYSHPACKKLKKAFYIYMLMNKLT